MRFWLGIGLFFCFAAQLAAQNRSELGYQTTGRGIVWYRNGLPTHKPQWRLSQDTNKVMWVDTFTTLRYDWSYKMDVWYTKGTSTSALPPKETVTSGSATIDNRTVFWLSNNILHYYSHSDTAFVPFDALIVASAAPSNIAAGGSNAAAKYTTSLWQDKDDHKLYRWDGAAWVEVGTGGGGTTETLTNSSDATSHTVTLTPGTTSLQMVEGVAIGLATTGTAGNGILTITADTSILATINDMKGIVDTVIDYPRLRIYNGQAYLVFVKKDGIEGLFKRVTSGVDDGGVNIVGTNKWRRVSPNNRIVNVRWFGAVGDSITDDNTAIQAAVAFCKDSTNATLYFPKGKYRYTSPIVFYKPVNLSIRGDGMHNTYLFPVNVTGIRIRTDSTTTVSSSFYGTYEGRDLILSDFSIMRVGAFNFNGKIQGLDLRGGFNKTLQNLRIEEFFGIGGTGQGSIGIRLWPTLSGSSDAVQHTVFRNVYVAQCDTGIVSRLQNTLTFYDVKVDANKDVGLALSNPLSWFGGLCQGNENTGIWLRNSDPFVLNEVTINGVHFEANASVAPKWGGIYKNDNTDMSDLSIKNCLLSSPGNTHMIRLRRVQNSEIVNNRYSGNSTTDTISLTSFYNVLYGNDNYTSLKLITSDAYIHWLNGSPSGVNSQVGTTIGTATPGANMFGVAAGIAIGATYALSNTAPTNGAIIQGDVGIGNSSPQRDLHVTGEVRVTDLTTDPPTRIVGADADGDFGAITVGTGLTLDGSGNLTANDASATNELQTLDNTSNATSHTVTLSNSGGSVQFIEGSNITLTTGGTALNATLTIASTGGASTPDSTWAKSVGGGYANKRITDPIYRSANIRVNMGADSAALKLKYHSSQTAPIFTIDYNNGTSAAWAHVYNSTNPSLVFGKVTSVDAASANNTVFGITAPTFTSGAGQNTLIGRLAGNACSGCYENTYVGSSAGVATIGGFQNVFIGYLAGQSNTSGFQNMFLGRRAGSTNVSGSNNVYLGSDAGRLATGTGNVFIGGQSGDQNTGSTNTFLGYASGRTNTGSDNVFIGESAGELTSGSNLLIIDNSNTSTPLVGGDFSNNRFGINTAPASTLRSLHVTGETRITDLATDTPTRIVGADADGDLDTVGIGAEAELHLTNGTLGTNFHTTISPSQLTATQNDWNPTGLSTAWIIRLSGDASFRLITGIVAPSFAKRLILHNTGSDAILLPTQHTGSSAANRFNFGRDVILFGGKSIEIVYDPTTSRWRLLSKAGIYDDVEQNYINYKFVSPVSTTSADYDFWEVSSTAAASLVAPQSGLFGGVSVNTGTSSTGNGYVASKEDFFYTGNSADNATWAYAKAVIITPSSLSDGSNEYTLRIGFLTDAGGGNANDGVYFRYTHSLSSGQWAAVTTAGGSSSATSSGVTVSASSIYLLEVYYLPNTTARFFINGSLVATNTSLIPVNDEMKIIAEIEKSVGTSQRDFSIHNLTTSVAIVH
ncbi:MAG: hypothetical protein OHK0019_00180 [Saprospiraceae bacterium]